MSKLTALIVDDHSLIREVLVNLLRSTDKFSNVYTVADGQQSLQLLKEIHIDILLLDIHMKGMSGIDVLSRLPIVKTRHQPKIMVLTAYAHRSLFMYLLKQGVRAYIIKTMGISEIKEAVNKVILGELVYPKEFDQVSKQLIQEGNAKVDFSPAELEFIRLIRSGATNKEIATQLNCSVRTVESRRLRLEKLMKARNTAEMVSTSYRIGIPD